MPENKIEKFLDMSLDQVMSDRFGRYAKYVIQGRALPDARDGLKPVQRRILFSMFELGLLHNRPFKKSARVVGDVIGKYHPHGDSSIYEAMVRMTQYWKMNEILVTMHGNNGSIDDDPAAAMRYTETRLSKIGQQMLKGIDKDTVMFAPNFDDSEKEPTVLPAIVPNLLVNGAKGIAAGYATEMPPHNLGEIIDGIIATIKSPNIRLSSLMKYVKGPDFPTGGTIQGVDGISDAFERGKGRIVIRSKYEINDSKTKPSIKITEIPYGVVKSKLVREIDEVKYGKNVSGIKEVQDQTDRNGMLINIELTPGTNPYKIINYLLSKTQMQVYYTYNNIAIKDAGPHKMGLKELIDAYLKHQREVQTNLINYDLKKDNKRSEIVDGLIKVAAMSDEVINVIRNAKGSKKGVVIALMESFNFTELQSNAIAELRLYRLSRTDQSVYIDEKEVLRARIDTANAILSSPESLDEYIIGELKKIKKEFATPRKSVIEDLIEDIKFNPDELIKHEETWVGVTRQGYIKRFSNRVYEANELITYGVKDSDNIIYIHKINTADKLLIFTNEGQYVYIPVHKIEESKFKGFGKHINDFAAIGPDAKIIGAVSVNDFSLPAFIVLATRKGKVKRTLIKSFEVSVYKRPRVAMKLAKGDQLIAIKPTNGSRQVVLITIDGKAVKYPETSIGIYGTTASGVKGITLSTDDRVGALVVAPNDSVIGMVSKRGGAKRVKMSSISSASKTTQGKRLFRLIKGNPHIPIDAAIVKPTNRMIFRDIKSLTIEKFNKVDITTPNDGFTSVGPSKTMDAKILVLNRIHKDSGLFDKKVEGSHDEMFKSAEDKINAVDQISLDDLLKNLK